MLTVEELIKELETIKDKQQRVAISFDKMLIDVESIDWMDTSDAILLFVDGTNLIEPNEPLNDA